MLGVGSIVLKQDESPLKKGKKLSLADGRAETSHWESAGAKGKWHWANTLDMDMPSLQDPIACDKNVYLKFYIQHVLL